MYSTRKTVKHYQVGDMGIMKDGYPDIKLHDCYAIVLKLQKTIWNNGCGTLVEVDELVDDKDGDIILLMTSVKYGEKPYLVRTSMKAMRKHFTYMTSAEIDPIERQVLLHRPCNIHLLW